MVYLEINAISYGYTPEQVCETLSVGEMKEILSMYDDDTPVLLSFDGGYMYGPVSSNNIEEKETEEDNEQETEEDDEQ